MRLLDLFCGRWEEAKEADVQKKVFGLQEMKHWRLWLFSMIVLILVILAVLYAMAPADQF